MTRTIVGSILGFIIIASAASCSHGDTSVRVRTSFSGTGGVAGGGGATVVVTSSLVAAPVPAVPAARPFAPLRAPRGDLVVDDQGRTVLLRGVNYSERGKTPPFTGWHSPASFDLIARSGFAVIRLLLVWEAIEPSPGHYDLGYLADVRSAIAECEARGIRVILDMHQDQWSRDFGGDGAPAWATLDSPWLPNLPGIWFPLNYANPEVIRNFHRFWRHDALKRSFRDAWVTAARELGGSPAVIGWDLINEPFPGFELPASFDRGRLSDFHAMLIPALRAVDPDGIAFVEANIFTSFGIPAAIRAPSEPNVVYAPHWYDATIDIRRMLGWDPFTGDTRGRCAAGLSRHLAFARSIGLPLWLGEYGADLDDPRGARLVADHQDVMNELLIGGCLWTWHPTNPHHMSPVSPGNVAKPALASAARPYPIATAGALRRVRFDEPSATLEVVFDADPAVAPDAATEIALAGELWYPAGFIVESSDAPGTWASAIDAATGRLVVTHDPAATTHTITIRPR